MAGAIGLQVSDVNTAANKTRGGTLGAEGSSQADPLLAVDDVLVGGAHELKITGATSGCLLVLGEIQLLDQAHCQRVVLEALTLASLEGHAAATFKTHHDAAGVRSEMENTLLVVAHAVGRGDRAGGQAVMLDVVNRMACVGNLGGLG